MRAPDLILEGNRAWIMAMPPDNPPATLRRWLLHCPAQKPRQWCMSIIHLRGAPAAAHMWPDSTHDIAVYAADPRWPDQDPDQRPPKGWLLRTGEQRLQFRIQGDELALRVLAELVRMCLIGEISLDCNHIPARMAKQHWQLGLGAAVTRVCAGKDEP